MTKRILVTGATGYIGGRLVPALLEHGYEVRCVVRNAQKLARAGWRDDVEVVVGDVLDPGSLKQAMDGMDAAFYLIHSMGKAGDSDFAEVDLEAAGNFADAAAGASLQRIVYLGGLGGGDDLSPHLKSRQAVGRRLADGPTPVTELRAGVIIGSGSASFEMLRYLTEVLPVMVTPTWVRTRCQPLAVRDAVDLLVAAIQSSEDDDHVHEIGGPDQVTYEEMMRIYQEVAGLPRRRIIPVPFLSPWLSSHWVGLVTPVPPGVAKPLVESLRNEVVVSDDSFVRSLGRPLLGYREAVTKALGRSHALDVPTRWSDASASAAQASLSDPEWSGGTELTDVKVRSASASAEALYTAFTRIGGTAGYYTMNWAWGLRGLIDTLVGGVGLRRGRRHPEELRLGEALDFWRVVDIEPGRHLRLRAEMKLPGDAWLSFEAESTSEGSKLTQTALFRPRGLLGRLYWWVMLPFHLAIFGRMADRIVDAAEQFESSAPSRRTN